MNPEDNRISSPPALDARAATKNVLAPVAAALVLFTGFFWLGFHVVRHGEPPALWAFAKHARGQAIWVAWALTHAGWAEVLAPLFAVCVAVAIFVPRWRVRALYLFIIGLLSWGCADGFQRLFARPRRVDWLIRHEHAFSYPSSHASIATGFYFVAAIVMLRCELAAWLRYSSFAALTLLWLGILWSRLSLGAHYATDLIGGFCLGLVLALVGAALLAVAGARLDGG